MSGAPAFEPRSAKFKMTERGKHLLWGWLIALIGLGTAAGVHWQPEQLNAPPWVAYAACATFVFAGLSVIGGALEGHRMGAWFVVALVAAMAAVGSWVAFGSGVCECAVSIPWFSGVGSDLLGRAAFGFGTIVTSSFLLGIVVRLPRQPRQDE